MLYTALFIFGICGIAGVLVDLDHLWNKSLDYTKDKRFHRHILIVGCVILSGCISYFGGLLVGQVLR